MQIIVFNRQWIIRWPWVVITLLVVAILIGLTLWQWQRAMDKAKLLQRLAQSQSINAQQLKHLPSAAVDGLMLATLVHWLPPFVWLLDNQILQGRPGYDVIIPVNTDANGDILLVNLGWIAAPLIRSQLPVVDIPSSFIVEGMLRTRLGGLRLGENIENNGRWPMRIQQIDTAELSQNLKRSIYPGVVYQLHNSPYVAHYQPVVVSPDRHRAYALQWSLLAIAVIIVALAASFKSKNGSNKELPDEHQ